MLCGSVLGRGWGVATDVGWRQVLAPQLSYLHPTLSLDTSRGGAGATSHVG